ncbi:MAG TPA: UDP-N-acetylglucosamine 1-carboxyvinyltransferase [Desulfomonilia bacterium]|nr:UDP-N-acetylglucosamine 1-carboxyvinyltransferase [Deltaproteobacteria bacterium]HPD20244.1 UDP-N-acetylglucosamine 1-carboxyvinyltransferase [Deltaproteobacteria bacterium]HRS57277.1 UDP-N-acetylglucosamine 1-carboxyvinyltransferase [Desulfomonilia bacterium]HRV34961.1 UDP-N-acetylglucosamine 1-carboxyvinyltransferase [Desulfomonilia bacterium]
MDKFIICGGTPLQGEVSVSGSKNASLPVMCSSILADGPCTYTNVPKLRDISTMGEVLSTLGMRVERTGDDTIEIDPAGIRSCEAPYDLVKSMRASILVLGPLLAKFGRAKVSLPGGCAIGVRPIDMHLKALARMGAEINLSHGYVMARTNGRLKGATIVFDKTTVGGTENILMAAALAEGTTIIQGAAKEPEVVDLAHALNTMGARIEGAGESTITIKGVESLSGTNYRIIPDRIETGTLIVASAITKGRIVLRNHRADHLVAVIEKLFEMGVSITELPDGGLLVDGTGELKPVQVETVPFPGFPTDMQAQIMALACVAKGVSRITENIFENRFMHVPELMRMGADLQEAGNTVIVQGVERFQGASVMATDLRASASLVLAALNARGYTEIRRIYHLDRGYERLDAKLAKLGAQVVREKGDL